MNSSFQPVAAGQEILTVQDWQHTTPATKEKGMDGRKQVRKKSESSHEDRDIEPSLLLLVLSQCATFCRGWQLIHSQPKETKKHQAVQLAINKHYALDSNNV